MSPVLIAPYRFAVAGGGGGLVTLTITIDHTKCGTADTTNFPLVVDITNAALKSVANGGSIADAQGDDIVFTSDFAGTTVLSYDPLYIWNASTGRVVTTVKVPTLSHASDTVIYCQAGKSGVTTFQGGSTGAAWDANFKSAYSFGDGSTLNLNDLTSNGNTLTNHTAGSFATATAGPAGGAIDMSNAVTDNQWLGGANILNISHPTFEGWIKIASNPGFTGQAFGLVDLTNNATLDKDISVQTDGKVQWYVFASGAIQIVSTHALSTGGWHHVVGRADGSNSTLYIDAASEATTAAGNTFAGYTNPNTLINKGGIGHGGLLNCQLAYIRLSDTARSDSYVTSVYNNINSPSTFYTVT